MNNSAQRSMTLQLASKNKEKEASLRLNDLRLAFYAQMAVKSGAIFCGSSSPSRSDMLSAICSCAPMPE